MFSFPLGRKPRGSVFFLLVGSDDDDEGLAVGSFGGSRTFFLDSSSDGLGFIVCSASLSDASW